MLANFLLIMQLLLMTLFCPYLLPLKKVLKTLTLILLHKLNIAGKLKSTQK